LSRETNDLISKITCEIIRLMNTGSKDTFSLWYYPGRDEVWFGQNGATPHLADERGHVYVGRLDCLARTYGYGGLGGFAAMELAAEDVLRARACRCGPRRQRIE